MTIPRKSSRSTETGNASMTAWVSAFLSEKTLTSVRKINEWQNWAIIKLASGWEPERVKQRIRDAWAEWVEGGNVDTKPMTHELLEELKMVYQMATEGATPETCAVVYRSLARKHPDRHWLLDAARRWEDMGTTWKPFGP